MGQDALENIFRAGDEFEVEVIEWAPVSVVGFARQSIDKRYVEKPLVASGALGCTLYSPFGYRGSEVPTMKYAGSCPGHISSNRLPKTRRLNPVMGEIAVAPTARQNLRNTVGFFQCQAGHPKQRLPEKTPRYAACDLIVF